MTETVTPEEVHAAMAGLTVHLNAVLGAIGHVRGLAESLNPDMDARANCEMESAEEHIRRALNGVLRALAVSVREHQSLDFQP